MSEKIDAYADKLCVRHLCRIADLLDMDQVTLRNRIKKGGPLSKIVRKDPDGGWYAITDELKAFLRSRRVKAS